jgi:hypothetical protein
MQNRIEDLEISPSCYRHLNLDKGAKSMFAEKTASLLSGVGKAGYSHVEERN